jgi:hypothetical protein
MIGLMQYLIYLVALHLVYKGFEIIYVSLAQGRGLIQQLLALVLLVIALLFALVIVYRADQLALVIGTKILP